MSLQETFSKFGPLQTNAVRILYSVQIQTQTNLCFSVYIRSTHSYKGEHKRAEWQNRIQGVAVTLSPPLETDSICSKIFPVIHGMDVDVHGVQGGSKKGITPQQDEQYKLPQWRRRREEPWGRLSRRNQGADGPKWSWPGWRLMCSLRIGGTG